MGSLADYMQQQSGWVQQAQQQMLGMQQQGLSGPHGVPFLTNDTLNIVPTYTASPHRPKTNADWLDEEINRVRVRLS